MFDILGLSAHIINNKIRQMDHSSSTEAIQNLGQWLGQSDMQVRQVVQIAAQKGDGDPIPGLLEFVRGENVVLALAAIQALVYFAPDENDPIRRSQIVQVLLHELSHNRPPTQPTSEATDNARRSLHACAAETLGRMGDRLALNGLIKALGDENPAAVRQAAWALGRVGDARAVPHLRDLLSSSDPEIRSAANIALHALNA